MPNPNLESLKPELAAIKPERVLTPDLPMAVALQESHDLATLVGKDGTRAGLLKVGLDAEVLDRLPRAVDATRAAQSDWVVARDRTKPDDQKQREEETYALRGDMLAACRWNLRHDRVGLATVEAIAEGEGIEDAIQDLRDLAQLVTSRRPAFDADETFNAAESTERAQLLAARTERGLSSMRLTDDQAAIMGLRDRAYTYLADLVSDIREAGRYAFRSDPEMKSRFASEYLRRKRRRAAARAAAPAASTGAAGAGAGGEA